MFASKTPRDLNHDPEPILLANSEGRIARWEWELLQGPPLHVNGSDSPRPEFDHVQHNQPNPILVEFCRMIRDDWDIREGELWMYAGSWVDLMDEDPHMSERINWGTLAGTEQPAIDHARRVLTRLARFQEHA